jgi:hypothetical protein
METKKLTIAGAVKEKKSDTQEYKHKINNFIHDNQFKMTYSNPTKHYQKTTKQKLKQCNITKKKYGNT